MNVLVVYAHPSENSFTYKMYKSFVKGLEDAGHNVIISDLYKMNFNETFSEKEYLREAFYDENADIPDDIKLEHDKLDKADIVVFIYPVFWTEAPAKLVGWFQRVWTYGYVYGNNIKIKKLNKALFLVTMGGSLKDEIRRKQVEAMKTVMIGDRINYRAETSDFIVFDEMTRGYANDDNRDKREEDFIIKAYELGKTL